MVIKFKTAEETRILFSGVQHCEALEEIQDYLEYIELQAALLDDVVFSLQDALYWYKEQASGALDEGLNK
jgi:hypothetical protein